MFGPNASLQRNGSLTLLTVAAGLCLAGFVLAQPPPDKNLLEQTRRTNAVAGQRLESEVRGALQQSQRLAATQPDKAVDRLKAALAKLDDDSALPEERRQSLRRVLERRIKDIETGADAKALDEKQVQAAIRRFENKKDLEAKDAENEKVRVGLGRILDLQKNGKFAEAKREADELARQFPGHQAAQNMILTVSAFDQVASARSLKHDKEERMVGALRDIDRSATPPRGDIEFPKDWKERTKGRTASRVQLSAREKAILRALDTLVTVNFKDDKFQDVMEYLSTVTGQPILLSKSDLNDAGVTYESPVSLAARNVTVRTILRKVLGEFGLTYVVKDQAIQVVSALKARDMMVTRAYYIGDLITSRGGPGDPLTYFYGPGIGQLAMMQNIASIMSMVQTSIDPQSWQANGGPGAIYFHAPTLSIVIKQSAEVHAMIAGSF